MSTPSKRTSKRSFSIGVDFGTLSARAILVDVANGKEIARVEHTFKHGVITAKLPGDKKPLPEGTALQHPGDYLDALKELIPALLTAGKVSAEQVVGIGTDFTACTILPTKSDGTPLCFDKKWEKNPQAWAKLWKHHSAQPEADRINELGKLRLETFLKTYGGKYSAEWFFSKVLETIHRSAGVYSASRSIVEAGDWVTWQLCGRETRNYAGAAFKAMYINRDRDANWVYPEKSLFRVLDPKMENVVADKMKGPILPSYAKAGEITEEASKLTGLAVGTTVAVGNIDAHASVPGSGVTTTGTLVTIIGTSTCHLLLGSRKREVEGMCGVVENGIVPGFWGYEAGQAGVGDMFSWFAEKCVPEYIYKEAEKARKTVYAYLESQAAKLKAGECALLALDWWGGNRSTLVDVDLTGLLVGTTLATQPYEIYRALLESTAFGARKIIDAFHKEELQVKEIMACGGIASKSPLILQIYADVTGIPVRLAASDQTGALGSAIHAAVAAGVYPDVATAVESMTVPGGKIFKPDPRSKKVYDVLYHEYSRLYEAFGRDPNSPMKILKGVKQKVLAKG